MTQSPTNRDNLSTSIEHELLEMIFDGRLVAGERINEVRLAEQLGVSRTPLREALTRLAADSVLESLPRRGFFLQRLTVEEFDAIYKIRPILDPAALQSAGLPSEEQLQQLHALNRTLARAGTPDELNQLDDRWHLLLLSHCPNPVLLDLIEQFMRRTRRYELAYLREQDNVSIATAEHDEILSALEARDVDRACRALHTNLTSGFGFLRAWLVDLETTGEPQRGNG